MSKDLNFALREIRVLSDYVEALREAKVVSTSQAAYMSQLLMFITSRVAAEGSKKRLDEYNACHTE